MFLASGWSLGIQGGLCLIQARSDFFGLLTGNEEDKRVNKTGSVLLHHTLPLRQPFQGSPRRAEQNATKGNHALSEIPKLLSFMRLCDSKTDRDLRDKPRRGFIGASMSLSLTTMVLVNASWLVPLLKAFSSALLFSRVLKSRPRNQLMTLSLSEARLLCHLRKRHRHRVIGRLSKIAAVS